LAFLVQEEPSFAQTWSTQTAQSALVWHSTELSPTQLPGGQSALVLHSVAVLMEQWRIELWP
jgi:hypothetical protein